MATVDIKGFKELDEELARLPLKLQKKYLDATVREGAKVVQVEAKKLAPKRVNEWEGAKYNHPAGYLKSKGIVVRKWAKQKNKNLTTFVAAVSKKAYYGMWVEFGHRLVRGGAMDRTGAVNPETGGVRWSKRAKKHLKFGKVVGWVSAKPFMRPAFDKSQFKIIEAMKNKLSELLKTYRAGNN